MLPLGDALVALLILFPLHQLPYTTDRLVAVDQAVHAAEQTAAIEQEKCLYAHITVTYSLLTDLP